MKTETLNEWDFNLLEDMQKTQFCILARITSISKSGMTRKARISVILKNSEQFRPLYLNPLFRKLEIAKQDKNGDLVLKGCGMDVIFSALYDLEQEIRKRGYNISNLTSYEMI